MIKNFKSFIRITLLVFCLIPSQNLLAMHQQQGPTDPLRGMDYDKAFNQKEIYKQFRDIIEYWQCNDNVFSITTQALPQELTVDEDENTEEQQAPSRNCLTCCLPWSKKRQSNYKPIPVDPDKLEYDEFYRKARTKEFVEACLTQLKKTRRKAILRPERRAWSMLGFATGATTGAAGILGMSSFGGSFAVMNAMYMGVGAIKDIIEARLTLHDCPDHPLNQLEELFACTKCFIPNKLWAPITTKFSQARNSSDVAQLTCINFIEFALTLTCAQKKQHASTPNTLENISKAEVIRKKLEERIDKFFENYEPAERQIATIKFAVGCFIDSLINSNDPNRQRSNPRYQFLVSSQGLGKTKFVKELNEWIQEEMPGYVYFKSCSAHDSAELEGGNDKRGLFLEILSSQLKEHKSGAMVLLDEPDWIDKTGGVARDAKRTFNGDLAEVSTKCFGPDALLLPLPPMLIFVNSNSPITEDALEKRFDIGAFPKPKLASLITYAKNRFRTNYLYDCAEKQSRISEVESFLEKAISDGHSKQFTSFRDIENGTELWSRVHLLLDQPPRPSHVLGGTDPIPENLRKYIQ